MASLMEHPIESARKRILGKTGQDAMVVRTQRRTEWMLGLVETASLKIEADPLSDPFGEPLLRGDRKMSFDDRGP
jgi:hypothetical protein